MGPGGGRRHRKKIIEKKKRFLQKSFEEHRANNELKEDVVWQRGEEGVSIYIYHPRASHNPLECDMNDGGGGKVPWRRSLTCEFMQIRVKPELMVFRV